jgi:hypothetical protein
MTSWEKTRQLVFQRDNYRCQTCLENKATDIHHIIPRRKIPLDLINNLVSLCEKCHGLLDLKPLSDIIPHRVIAVKADTHGELNAIGVKGETMDDIIKKCLKAYKERYRK